MSNDSNHFLLDMFIDHPGSENIPSGVLKNYAYAIEDLLRITLSIMPDLDLWLKNQISSNPHLKDSCLSLIANTFLSMLGILVDDPSESLALFKKEIAEMEKTIDKSDGGKSDES